MDGAARKEDNSTTSKTECARGGTWSGAATAAEPQRRLEGCCSAGVKGVNSVNVGCECPELRRMRMRW